jgi:hypothetical protein
MGIMLSLAVDAPRMLTVLIADHTFGVAGQPRSRLA